jgi:lipopolysaccharide exporter
MNPDGAGTLLARTARGAGWVMAWRLGMRGLGLISTLVLVRLLRPEDFGLIALGTGFMQTIDGMMLLGIEEAVIRDPHPTRHVYDTAFTLNLLRGLAATMIVLAAAYPAAAFFAEPRLGPILLFVAVLPLLDGVANIGAVDFRRDFAFHKEFAIMVLPKLGGILAAIAGAILLRDYTSMLCGIGVNRTLRMIMSYVMHPFRPRLSLRAWHGLVGYSVWTWLLSLTVLLRERSDTLLLGRLMGSAPVGFYAVGAEIAALPTTELIEPLCRASFSGFAAAHRTGLAVGDVYLRLMGTAALLTLPAGVGLAMVAGPLVGVAFGPGWDAAVPVLRVLALAGTAMVFGQLSVHLLSAHALLGRLVGVTLTGALLRVALLAALIPPFGLIGAAFAAGIAIAAEQVLTVAMALRRFGVTGSALARQVWRPALAAAAMAATLDAAHHVLASRLSFQAAVLMAEITIGATVYGVTAMACWHAADRPDGAEVDGLRLIQGWLGNSPHGPPE